MEMNISEAIDYIHEHTDEIADRVLKKDGSGKGYVCPACGSGSHSRRGTGMTRNKNSYTYTCWSGNCYRGKDIIDIFGDMQHKDKLTDKVKSIADVLNITVISDTQVNTGINKKLSVVKKIDDKVEDYTSEIEKYEKLIENTDYYKKRGLSIETARAFHLGYCPSWIHPLCRNDKEHKQIPSERLIIPTSEGHYIARAISNTIDKKYKAMKAGASKLFCVDYLLTSKANENVYVVEGEIDAMSFYEVGAKAVAIGGVSMINEILMFLNQNHKNIKCNIVFALDNDQKGEESSILLGNTLYEHSSDYPSTYSFADVDMLYCHRKDANEALCNDRDKFKKNISLLTPQYQYIKQESSYANLLSFLSDNSDTVIIPTCYSALDSALDGGLTEGLYILGGQSSLGKTTFLQQIADKIADNNTDVLFFSLEMSQKELIAKSLSRLTFEYCDSKEENAKTTKGIMIKARRKNYSPSEMALIRKSVEVYSTSGRASHLFYRHENTPMSIEYVRKAVQKHIDMTNRKPVVIVDYLQIMAPINERYTDKMNTDKNVFGLKAIAVDFNIPVIATSSLNRDNYYGDITLKAFKESGAIEYTADVLIGLQFRDFQRKKSELSISDEELNDKLKREKVREIEVKILKNRSGETGTKIAFDYHSMFNAFIECEKDALEKAFGNDIVKMKQGSFNSFNNNNFF